MQYKDEYGIRQDIDPNNPPELTNITPVRMHFKYAVPDGWNILDGDQIYLDIPEGAAHSDILFSCEI